MLVKLLPSSPISFSNGSTLEPTLLSCLVLCSNNHPSNTKTNRTYKRANEKSTHLTCNIIVQKSASWHTSKGKPTYKKESRALNLNLSSLEVNEINHEKESILLLQP
jgi:hypothetical protein